MTPVTIRASSIATLQDCPARFEAEQLLGMRTPRGSKALLGSAIHSSTARYDQSVLNNEGITVNEAAAAAVDAIRNPKEDIAFDDDDNVQQIEDIAVALHTRYCEEIAPTQQYVAVEVRVANLEISDLGLILTGTTDRVARHGEDYGIRDLKSGGSAVKADGTVEIKGHAAQLGIYELLAEHGSGLPIKAPAKIVGLQTGKTMRGQRVAVSRGVTGAREMLIGNEDSPGLLTIASRMIHAGNFIGNPRSMFCGAKYCAAYNNCRWRL